jgi:hypothetical protein
LLLFSPCLIFAALENGAAFFGWGIASMRGRNEGKEKEWSRRAQWLDIR